MSLYSHSKCIGQAESHFLDQKNVIVVFHLEQVNWQFSPCIINQKRQASQCLPVETRQVNYFHCMAFIDLVHLEYLFQVCIIPHAFSFWILFVCSNFMWMNTTDNHLFMGYFQSIHRILILKNIRFIACRSSLSIENDQVSWLISIKSYLCYLLQENIAQHCSWNFSLISLNNFKSRFKIFAWSSYSL